MAYVGLVQLICEYSTIRLEWPVAFRSASLLAGSFARLDLYLPCACVVFTSRQHVCGSRSQANGSQYHPCESSTHLLRSSRDAGSRVRRNSNVASVPGFFIWHTVSLREVRNEFRARYDEQCKRLLLVCGGRRSNLRMAESIYPIGADLRVLAGNREIVRIPRRTKDFHHELVQTR